MSIKRRLISYFLFIVLLLIVITVNVDELFKHSGEVVNIKEESEYHVLERNMDVRQTFKAKGNNLEAIKIKFGYINPKSGVVSVFILDSDNNILSEFANINLGAYSEGTVVVRISMPTELKYRNKYTLLIKCEGSMNASIGISEDLDIFDIGNSLIVNNNVLNSSLMVNYVYDTYYEYSDIVIILLIIIIIGICWFKNIRVSEKYIYWWNEVCFLVVSIGIYMVFDVVNNTFGINENTLFRIISNVLPIYIIVRILYIIFNTLIVAVGGATLIGIVFAIGNFYVDLFRGRPILPWDITSLRTAMAVAESYDFTITLAILYAVLIVVFIIVFCLMVTCTEKPKRHLKIVLVNGMIVTLGIALYITGIYPKLKNDLWNMGSIYDSEGVVAGFLGHIKFCIYEKPENYSTSGCEELLKQTEIIKSDENKITPQNIIVIMNESFSDLRVINNDKVSNDYMPFVDSLTNNVVKGNLYAPVYGAGTSDVEFEILTGLSVSSVPKTPYQTQVKPGIESMVSVLKKNGFYEIAMHPHEAINWNREAVYAAMGFDDFISLEDMEYESSDLLRWCMSDRKDYEIIIEQYEKNKQDKFFMFNVTMQNHGGYEGIYDGFSTSVDLSAQGNFPKAENYYSLIKYSDQEIGKLIDYFQQVEEPTMICFFGDHQPTIEDEYFEFLYGKELKDLTKEEYLKRYVTPFFIWTNYDIEEAAIDKISSNYLGILILKMANIELPEYESWLYDLYLQYPVISNAGIVDKNGQIYSRIGGVVDEKIQEYEYLQYYRLRE